MCDTIVVMRDKTFGNNVIFAKNSDRDPNEAHEVKYFPRRECTEDMVKCTYMEVPQVDRTNAIFLLKPFWIWGCEMGANEHGVVMGNEAVFTKHKVPKKGLLGMDLMRLALERGDSARACMEIIIDLVERYGQGGQAGFDHEQYYNNSYLIADYNEAWVLETTGHLWVAEKVKAGIRTISNGLTIEDKWDRASKNLTSNLNFKKKFSDFLYTTGSKSKLRRHRTQQYLQAIKGQISILDLFTLLRMHEPNGKRKTWKPSHGNMENICMHAGPSFFRPSQTTGSLVSVLFEDSQLHWYTGTAAPCTSIFKPFTFNSTLPDMGPPPERNFNEKSLWWRHELLHRLIIRDYPDRIKVIEKERDDIEEQFVNKALNLIEKKASSEEWTGFISECFQKAMQLEDYWLSKIKSIPIQGKEWRRWDALNKKAGIPI
ncbi:MAG: C69 family dipeptidase [Promethearchaeota archaeon]